MRYWKVYSTLNKITQFRLVESSTINPKLYPLGVPIKFPWKRRVRKEMADTRFAILMDLFLPNKELFTNFVMFNHAWKHEEDRWNYFQCYTKPNFRVATILAWFWWLCYHVNWKLHHSLQFWELSKSLVSINSLVWRSWPTETSEQELFITICNVGVKGEK